MDGSLRTPIRGVGASPSEHFLSSNRTNRVAAEVNRVNFRCNGRRSEAVGQRKIERNVTMAKGGARVTMTHSYVFLGPSGQ